MRRVKNKILRMLGFGCWTCYRRYCQYKRLFGVCQCYDCHNHACCYGDE